MFLNKLFSQLWEIFWGACLYVGGYSRSFFWSQHIPLSTLLPVGKFPAQPFRHLAF